MAEYLGMTGPAAAYFGVRDKNQQLGDQAQAAQFQQATSLMGLIQAKQKMEQEQVLRGSLAEFQKTGDPRPLMSMPGGMTILKQFQDLQNSGVTADLHRAQIGNYGRLAAEDARKAAIDTTQRAHVTSLQDLFNPQTYARPELTHPADIVAPNEAAAIEALKQAEARGQPFTAQVPNPSAIRANVIGAGSALPAQVGKELLQGMTPKPAMTPYQRESLDLRREALDKPLAGSVDRPPSGYRPSANGGLEPIPGGPADRPKRSPFETATYNAGLKDVAKDQASVSTVEQIETALKRWDELNKTTTTGRVSGLRPAVGQPEFQELVRLENFLAVNNFKPGQGQISNFERQLIKGAGPSTNNDEVTNSRIVKVMLGAAQNAKDKADFKELYLESMGKTLGADKEWNDYINKNPRYVSGQGGALVENQNRKVWTDYFAGKLKAKSKTPAVSQPSNDDGWKDL